jgi:hypothetical protein
MAYSGAYKLSPILNASYPKLGINQSEPELAEPISPRSTGGGFVIDGFVCTVDQQPCQKEDMGYTTGANGVLTEIPGLHCKTCYGCERNRS